MTDVCPFSLGVATYNSKLDRDPHMAVLIPRSSMLPVSHSGSFYTLHDGQEYLSFEFYQGEDYFVSGNIKLGELRVRVPRSAAGTQCAEVTFTYDIDGILHVSVVGSGGDKRETVILNPNLHLSDEELDKAMERINNIRLTTEVHRDDRLFAQALSLFERLGDDRRAALGYGLGLYCSAMHSQDHIAIRRGEKYLGELVERFMRELEEDPFEPLYGLGMDLSLDEEEAEEPEEADKAEEAEEPEEAEKTQGGGTDNLAIVSAEGECKDE